MMRKLTLIVGCLISLTAGAATDADSLGRAVKYLDVGSSVYYFYGQGVTSCPAGTTAGSQCGSILTGAGLQTISAPDIARIDLPANATNSLLCFSITPYLQYRLANTTATAANAFLSFQTTATIESTALSNPALINKATGTPFDGKIAFQGLANYLENNSLPAGISQQKSFSFSKECTNGLISLRTLQSIYGLTLPQARAVFAAPMTVKLSATVQVINTTFVAWNLGFRLFGD